MSAVYLLKVLLRLRLLTCGVLCFDVPATVQVVLTLLGVALFAVNLAHLPGPSAIILGGALSMSTTAVAIQVLEDRGEMGSRCDSRCLPACSSNSIITAMHPSSVMPYYLNKGP
jgi:Kef-type K+ transport system membrane component KefB